jgi:hypothetical protein
MWEKKILEVQSRIAEQEALMPELLHKKEEAEVDLWKVRMESEGMKVVVQKLEAEIEQLRIANDDIAKQRKNYGPEENKLALDIENQLAEIKLKEKVRVENLKKISSAAMFKNLERMYLRILGVGTLGLRANQAETVIFRKKVFAALKISQKYLQQIKSKTLGKFKSLLRPWAEQQRLHTLLQSCRSLRVKSSTFARWRK